MTLEEVYEFYGSARRASKAIGVTRQAFYTWLKRGFIPVDQQNKYHALTKGILKADKNPKANMKLLNILAIHLPTFRYYSESMGMCHVKGLTFRKGTSPRISYCNHSNHQLSFSSFNTNNLMQLTELKDIKGIHLYEGDIILCEGEEIIFNNIYQLYDLKLDEFLIIGNIFEGKK